MTTAAELPSVGFDIRSQDQALPLAAPKPQRLQSLDIFRGITIAGMLLVNNVDEAHAYKPLLHSNWNGWTPTDLIFPFFMFIVGVAIPFSMAKRLSEPGQTKTGLLGHVWARALALVMLGFLIHIVFSHMPPLPSGHAVLGALRWITMVFGYAGIIGLLMPIRSQRISNWLPPITAAIFLLLIVSLHFVVKHATDSGLPQSAIGSGIFEPNMFRIPGVLQRIGICYGLAATIALFSGWRSVLACAIALLVIYSVLMFKVPFHDHVTGSLTKQDNLEHSIDQAVFDRFTVDENGKRHYTRKLTYGEYADPEGLLSTIPATATPLLGILLGFWLRRTDKTSVEKCAGMLAMGVVVAILGQCMDSGLMPINKKIWTPSFVVFTAGLAMLGLGVVFWLVDVRGNRRWAVPFAIFGMNSIAAYAGSDVLVRIGQLIKVHGVQLNRFVEDHCTDAIRHLSASLQMHSAHFPVLDTPANLAMVFAIVLILATLVLLAPLYWFKIYLKV